MARCYGCTTLIIITLVGQQLQHLQIMRLLRTQPQQVVDLLPRQQQRIQPCKISAQRERNCAGEVGDGLVVGELLGRLPSGQQRIVPLPLFVASMMIMMHQNSIMVTKCGSAWRFVERYRFLQANNFSVTIMTLIPFSNCLMKLSALLKQQQVVGNFLGDDVLKRVGKVRFRGLNQRECPLLQRLQMAGKA